MEGGRLQEGRQCLVSKSDWDQHRTDVAELWSHNRQWDSHINWFGFREWTFSYRTTKNLPLRSFIPLTWLAEQEHRVNLFLYRSWFWLWHWISVTDDDNAWEQEHPVRPYLTSDLVVRLVPKSQTSICNAMFECDTSWKREKIYFAFYMVWLELCYTFMEL